MNVLGHQDKSNILPVSWEMTTTYFKVYRISPIYYLGNTSVQELFFGIEICQPLEQSNSLSRPPTENLSKADGKRQPNRKICAVVTILEMY